MFQTIASWLGWGGLFRGTGVQSPQPGHYNQSTPATVTFDSAMQLSAVWACARLLSETVAGLPITFYRQRNGSMKEDRQSDLAQLFVGKVNQYQTRVEFFETMMLNLVLQGNAYALKQTTDGGRLGGLLPLNSSQVVTRLLKDGEVVHEYHYNGGVTVLSQESVWHIKLFGNGVIGLSPLSYARNIMGIALAAESRVGETYRNGGKPTGVLTIDKVLNDKQRNNIRNEFKSLIEGNTDELMVLEAGMQFQKVSMSPSDIQLLESRRFQIEDIARFMGVPSVLINDTSGSTTWGSGVFQLIQGFYKLNLRPYLERIEASIVANLVPAGQRASTAVEFDFDALLRADQEARAKGYQSLINSGVLTLNEARLKEGLPPLAGGDELYFNGNMMPVRLAGQARQTKPAGT